MRIAEQHSPIVTDILDTRRARLRLLIAQWGGAVNLAGRLGYDSSSYISQMTTGVRPISEKTARKIENTLDLPTGWLDKDDAQPARPAPLDTRLLSNVVMLVQQSGITLAPAKFSEVVALVYEQAIASGQLDERFIERVIKLTR